MRCTPSRPILSSSSAATAGVDADDRAVVVEDGQRFGLVDHLGTGGFGGADQVGVELAPGPDRTVGREAPGAGPVELAAGTAGDHAETVDAMHAVKADLELLESGDRARRQAIAADLVASARALLEDEHRRATARGTHRCGCAGGATADDDQITSFHGHQRAS